MTTASRIRARNHKVFEGDAAPQRRPSPGAAATPLAAAPLNSPAPVIWTEPLAAELTAYWLAGDSGHVIAQKMGITYASAMSKARSLKLPSRRAGKHLNYDPKKSVSKPERDNKHKQKLRRCLGSDCGRTFMTDVYRLCPSCRIAATNASPMAI